MNPAGLKLHALSLGCRSSLCQVIVPKALEDGENPSSSPWDAAVRKPSRQGGGCGGWRRRLWGASELAETPLTAPPPEGDAGADLVNTLARRLSDASEVLRRLGNVRCAHRCAPAPRSDLALGRM